MDSDVRSAHGIAPAIELDVARNEQRKREAARHLNVLMNPALRAIGFALVGLAIWLHNAFVLRTPAADPRLIALVFAGYPLFT